MLFSLSFLYQPMPSSSVCNTCIYADVPKHYVSWHMPRIDNWCLVITLHVSVGDIYIYILYIYIQGMAEKLVSWPKYSPGMWPNKVYFST